MGWDWEADRDQLASTLIRAGFRAAFPFGRSSNMMTEYSNRSGSELRSDDTLVLSAGWIESLTDNFSDIAELLPDVRSRVTRSLTERALHETRPGDMREYIDWSEQLGQRVRATRTNGGTQHFYFSSRDIEGPREIGLHPRGSGGGGDVTYTRLDLFLAHGTLGAWVEGEGRFVAPGRGEPGRFTFDVHLEIYDTYDFHDQGRGSGVFDRVWARRQDRGEIRPFRVRGEGPGRTFSVADRPAVTRSE